jgi:citrate synthase
VENRTEEKTGQGMSKLRGDWGAITLDNGYTHTGSYWTGAPFPQGEKGIPPHRGYCLPKTCNHSNFL